MAWYFGAQEQVSITDFLSGVLKAEEEEDIQKLLFLFQLFTIASRVDCNYLWGINSICPECDK